ncbi:Nitrogen assimilation transcription factor nit-4-like protein 8 [Botrytis cinerea]
MLRNSLPQSKDEGISKIQDENLANPQPSDGIDGEGKKISKRKRGCLITTNACSSCKTARSKCDGERPCSRCIRRIQTGECFYGTHTKIVKEKLVESLNESHAINRMAERVFESLAVAGNEREVLNRIRNKDSIQDIAQWLGTTVDVKEQQSTLRIIDNEVDGLETSAFHWTTVTADKDHNIDAEDISLMTIQAFAILFLIDCAQGHGMHASAYLEVASTSLMNFEHTGLGSDAYRQVWRDTVVGVNNLNIEWAQVTFRMPAALIIEVPATKSIEEIQKNEAEVDDVIVRFFPKINRELGKNDEEAVKLATEVLEQSLLSFPVAAIFTEKFREITKKILFPWPSKLDNLMYHQRSKSRSLLDEVIDVLY